MVDTDKIDETKMAVYELRTYHVVVGKMNEMAELYKNLGWPALCKHPKKLVCYFTGDVGALIG